MAVVRPTENLDECTIRTYTVKANAIIVAGVGVLFTATEGEVDVAIANSKVAGVALTSITGNAAGTDTVQVALSGGIVKVKLSSTATRGEYAIAGTGGFENQTIGGGTTVKYLGGQFNDSGVVGDFVGMRLNPFAAGCA